MPRYGNYTPMERRDLLRDVADDMRILSDLIRNIADHASTDDMVRYYDNKTVVMIRRRLGLIKYALGVAKG